MMGVNERNGTKKLIRCTVSSKDKSASIRYIEFEVFKFWQYMMLHKHGFNVSDMSLCLWVDNSDYQQKKDIYIRAGEIASVSKIVVSIFDTNNGFTHTSSRFVPEDDANKVREILMTHIPKDVANSDDFEINTYLGKSIEKNKISRLDEMVLGLSGE